MYLGLVHCTEIRSSQINSYQIIGKFLRREENWNTRKKPLGSGARFSKVPKLYGAFSGVTIPFVSQERRGFNSSNFSCFSFCCLENMFKDRLSKTSGWQFHKWLFGPEKFSGLSRNEPQRRAEQSLEIEPRPLCWGASALTTAPSVLL